jgi:hypothetical protein
MHALSGSCNSVALCVFSAACLLLHQSSLGHVEFKLSEVLTATSRSLTLNLLKTSKPSTVTLVAEEMSGAREVLTIKMAASELLNIETLSKSDPFLEISRVNEGGAWLPVFRTEV